MLSRQGYLMLILGFNTTDVPILASKILSIAVLILEKGDNELLYTTEFTIIHRAMRYEGFPFEKELLSNLE